MSIPGFPDNHMMRFFENSLLRERAEPETDIDKFYFSLFMGIIIIVLWIRLYATASNT
jgi:hypothetical protein